MENLKTLNNQNLSIIRNQELNGVELYFSTKPIQNIIESLKLNGFRWHNVKKCWYAKENNETLEFIKNLDGSQNTEVLNNQDNKPIQPIYKSDFIFTYSGLKHKDKYFAGFYNFDMITLEIEFTNDSYSNLPMPENAQYRDDTDSQTDYFCHPSIILNPTCKDYLNALNGYIKSIEHDEKIASKKSYYTPKNYTDLYNNYYKQYKRTCETEEKLQDLANKFALRDLKNIEDRNNALKLAQELYNNPSEYETIKNKRVEEENTRQKQINIDINKREAKEMIENKKNFYFSKVGKVNNKVYGISEHTFQLIDFSSDGLSKPQKEYNLIIINEDTGIKEIKQFTDVNELQETIKELK